MNVNLGETLDRFVAELLESGLYQSQSEIIREGLRLLKEREDLRALRLSQLKAEVGKGIDDVRNGDFQTLDESSLRKAFDDSKARGRTKLEAKKARRA
jgi:antitoxin ParD1/3/4